VNPSAQPDAGRPGHEPPAWLASAGGRATPLTAKQDRDRAALAHLSLAFGVLGPLVVWLLYRDRGPFTSQESKEALNFSGPPTLITTLFFFLALLPVIGAIFAILGALSWAVMAVYGVMGASNVSKGRPFLYPFNLRILR